MLLQITVSTKNACVITFFSYSSLEFSIIWGGESSFHSPCSQVVSFYSFLLYVYVKHRSPQFWSSYISVSIPPSIFSLLHIPLFFSLHVLNHSSLTSSFVLLMFATPALALNSSAIIFSILFIHPSQQSHFCSFHQDSLSLSQCPGFPSIH